MQKLKKSLYDGVEIFVIGILILCFSIVMCFINHISLKNGISFWIFQIGGIILPGMAFMMLFNLKKITKLEFYALSYTVGYCLNIFVYYLTIPFGLKGILKYIILMVALFASIIIWKKRNYINECRRDKNGNIICLVFILVILIIEICTVCGKNFYPPNISENILFHDMLYWVGNTITLTRDYPAVSFREYPQPYTYHFFSSIQLAVISLITNIRPIILSFDFSFIQPIIIMVSGAYILFKKVCSKKILIALALLGLFFAEGKSDITAVTYVLHVFIAQFGFDIGMGIYIFFIYAILLQWKEKKFNFKICILTILFFLITTGAKSPYGAIGLCIAGIMCLSWLVKKNIKKAFSYGIPILIGFVLMYIFVVNLGSSDQPETSIIQTFLNAEPRIYTMSPLIQTWHNIIVSDCNIIFFKPFLEIVFLIASLILVNYFLYIPFFYFLAVKIIILKKWDTIDTVCVSVTAIGTIITMKWGNPDFSVAYFVMTTYVTAMLFILKSIQQFLEEELLFFGIRKKILIFLGIILLGSGIRDGYTQSLGYSLALQEGIRNIFQLEQNQPMEKDRAYISQDDYDTYEWIRFHTSEDTLIAGNKGLQLGRGDTSRHTRVIGVFTERYVIANDMTDALFYDLEYSKLEELQEMGIKYIIYNNTSTEGFVLPADQIVYANDTNIIYDLTK